MTVAADISSRHELTREGNGRPGRATRPIRSFPSVQSSCGRCRADRPSSCPTCPTCPSCPSCPSCLLFRRFAYPAVSAVLRSIVVPTPNKPARSRCELATSVPGPASLIRLLPGFPFQSLYQPRQTLCGVELPTRDGRDRKSRRKGCASPFLHQLQVRCHAHATSTDTGPRFIGCRTISTQE